MGTHGLIKKAEYFDSVTLMRIARDMQAMPGVEDAAAVMATKENKSILLASGLYLSDFDAAEDADVIVAFRVAAGGSADEIFKNIADLFNEKNVQKNRSAGFEPRSLEGALQVMPNAGLALISVAGRFAAALAFDALRRGLHVMLFSDNVAVEDELALKELGRHEGLLVMGPDCGTAILSGAPLGFANAISKGAIGIVAAAGTGLQEISSIITNKGFGISQAIGVGGRDVKDSIGAIMTIEALRALNADPATQAIVIVSKPPQPGALARIRDALKSVSKPVVAIFLGQTRDQLEPLGVIPAETLEEAALLAIQYSGGGVADRSQDAAPYDRNETDDSLQHLRCRFKAGQRFIRGLFSGGTLCFEANMILERMVGDIYGNAPLDKNLVLKDSLKSYRNTVVDLGDDEFTVGRPHPMIDYSLRNRRITDESADPEVAVILFDVVLGYGACMNPSEELAGALSEAKRISESNGRTILFVCSVTGTDRDPQDKKRVVADLKNAGVYVFSSNAAACRFAGRMLKILSPDGSNGGGHVD